MSIYISLCHIECSGKTCQSHFYLNLYRNNKAVGKNHEHGLERFPRTALGKTHRTNGLLGGLVTIFLERKRDFGIFARVFVCQSEAS